MAGFPEYYLVRVKTEAGWQLVTCRALNSINETKLPGDIAREVAHEFDARRKDAVQVIELPPGLEAQADEAVPSTAASEVHAPPDPLFLSTLRLRV